MKTLALLLVFCSSIVSAQIIPADGLWRTSDDPVVGSGVAMFTQGQQTLVSVFSYDESGQSRWYTAAGQIDNQGVFEAQLLETQNGTYITSENPQAAEFKTIDRTIRMTFDGSQTGTLSIDGAPGKAMQVFNFGVLNWRTENKKLADGSHFQFADLSGRWVVANSVENESFILELDATEGGQPSTESKVYVSRHYSTQDWVVSCPLFVEEGAGTEDYCAVVTQNPEIETMRIRFNELGNKRMRFEVGTDDNVLEYQAFKVSIDNKLVPSDGLWRTIDDPSVGSGMVMRTQGEATVVLLYSYDESGQAAWEIVSGRFDRSNRMVASLLRTADGSPIQSEMLTAATYTTQLKTITIELQGTELATLRIDDSEPKQIQHYKYGVEFFETEHLQPGGNNFNYPDLTGNWVFYAGSNEFSRSYTISINSENLYPTIPEVENSQQFSGRFQQLEYIDPFGMEVTCFKEVVNSLSVPFCESEWSDNDYIESTRVYYEDMGYRKFNMFSSSDLPPGILRAFSRQFIRLD